VIRDIHGVVSWAFIIANGLVGLWALAAHQWPSARHKAGWIAVGVAQAIIFLQVGLGVALQTSEDLDSGQHQLYGFAAFMSVGIIFAYRNEMRDKPYLLYGLGSLWLMGLGLRAIYLV
jgi:hypothetical protein